MDIETIKKYLSYYIDEVLSPRFIAEPNDDGIKSLKLHDVLKGSYQPPIVHIFMDTVPKVEKPTSSTQTRLGQVKKDVEGFIRMFGIKFPVKVHLNKRPFLKKGKTYDTNI